MVGILGTTTIRGSESNSGSAADVTSDRAQFKVLLNT